MYIAEFKTWAGGKDANNPDLITCTSDVSETDDTGTFEAHFEVTAVPAGLRPPELPPGDQLFKTS